MDRPAAKGDFANIDLTAEIDGETVDSQEGVSYELGSNTMLDGLDEALDGLSAGEETTFEGMLEAGEHEGQKATVKVKVNSVKAEELPELNDEFASEASEFDTLDELKADIRKAAAQDAEGRQATEARDAFIAKLQEGLEIPVPKGVKANMVEEQLKGMTPDPEKATKEQKAQAEETVEKDLRDQMVLDALAEKLDVQVSQSDVFNFLASIAQQYGMDPNNFIQAIIKNGQLGSAVQEVGRSRACSPACAPSSSPLMARLWTSPPSWARPLRTKSPSPSRPLPLLPPWPTNCPPRMTPRMLSEHSLIALA